MKYAVFSESNDREIRIIRALKIFRWSFLHPFVQPFEECALP